MQKCNVCPTAVIFKELSQGVEMPDCFKTSMLHFENFVGIHISLHIHLKSQDFVTLRNKKKTPTKKLLYLKILHTLFLRFVECSNNTNSAQNSAIQRPQPKKINLPGPGAIPPPPNAQNPPEDGPVSLPAFPPPKKEKPPPPPPRPFKTHGRSSSLDLNKLNKLGAPPLVPPRVSPNIQTPKKLVNQKSEGDNSAHDSEQQFANFEQFEKYENIPEDIFPGDYYEAERKKLFAQFTSPEDSDVTDAPRKHGAFEVYRKPTPKSSESPISTEDKAKWELFQKLQEQNTVLLRICQELSQELADVLQEKLALKVKLEKQMNGG